VRFLTVGQVVRIAQRVEPGAQVRDVGLLEAAVHRPQASVLGADAYPHLLNKAGAFMQSLIANHAFVDGNKRTGWAATEVFLGLNGVHLARVLDVDAAEVFTLSIAEGSLTSVAEIAEGLAQWVDVGRAAPSAAVDAAEVLRVELRRVRGR